MFTLKSQKILVESNDKNIRQSEWKRIKGKFDRAKKAVVKTVAVGVASLMLNMCSGETDLGAYRVVEDAVVTQDGGQSVNEDAGPRCASITDKIIRFKLKVNDQETVVKIGDTIKVGGKDFILKVDQNGNLVLENDKEVYTFEDGKVKIGNDEVYYLDRSVDLIGYSSRVMLKMNYWKEGDENSMEEYVILGNNKDTKDQVKIGDINISFELKEIESWDSGISAQMGVKIECGNCEVKNLEVDMNFSGDQKGKIDIDGRSIRMNANYIIEAFPIDEACGNVKPAIKASINGEVAWYAEGDTIKVGGKGISFDRIFPGETGETKVASVKIDGVRKNLKLGEHIEIESNEGKMSIEIKDIKFHEFTDN